MARQLKPKLGLTDFNLKGIYISTYIPRRCGIATYTKDLTNGINVLNPKYLAEILAMDDTRETVEYPWEIKYHIRKDNEKDYLSAAKYINRSSCDFVSLQHEYGIFGGEDGQYILKLVQNIDKPLITTFHTTLLRPSEQQKSILNIIASESEACVVMIKEAANRLKKIYRIKEDKILTIHHGVPNIPFSPSHFFKPQIGYSKKDFLIGAINLIAPNKGLEYVIKALPQIKSVYPNVKFLMIGATHPLVKINEDEHYRHKLKKLVKQLDLEANFVEINEYISLENLISYLKALDVYITPYLDRNQTSSGTLAYAIGAGKVCISTPYIYANETLAQDRGIIVPQKDEKAIAYAVVNIIKKPTFREKIEKAAYQYGRKMIWEHVALEYLNLFSYVVNKKKSK
ncbi:hypothetical protein A3C23_05040 [Candidatus Roizmanbacteria bacterium RIFCSPHIGHO2_02_FULL_37_13b]|uniref:Glycosyl transferase family 1 domain-containing protein n=1 Tax=Candidatus Roizmanbacteria bacterium RIFCSPLOWO2_02_FULL_36_11 TaxID=1802071 RepID=A0A1F7JIP9_9BACT|nr:MAG: hypothetical protein A3C23_05040 [Candidatus Roizmanbacteria bacterium RIFCSPHIGHO2_02_FULL_37_13b]OGK55461.1 MAG: hypothetical protein A3H78_01225 [Candidatus Roizmanbacteria bacterium RIFCSPLOWO2_02_FULL_36_11]